MDLSFTDNDAFPIKNSKPENELENGIIPNPRMKSKLGSDVGFVDLPKKKTSMRHRFEAEAEVISHEIGHLELIRRKLELSQRGISQLLLVDPSAWHRWVSGKTPAPPHIYRMLEWYFLIKEKHPALAAKFYEARATFDDKKVIVLEKASSEQKVLFSTVQEELTFLRDQQKNWQLERLALVSRVDSLDRKGRTVLNGALGFCFFVTGCLLWLMFRR